MLESFSSHLRTKIAKMVKMRWIWLSKISIVMAVNVERLVEDISLTVDVSGQSMAESYGFSDLGSFFKHRAQVCF